MVLVRVREDDPAHLRLVLAQVRDVGDDEVDAEHLLVGEHEAGVDDDDVVALLDGEHVLADLADAAKWNDAQRVSQRASSDPLVFFSPTCSLATGSVARSSASAAKSPASAPRSAG